MRLHVALFAVLGLVAPVRAFAQQPPPVVQGQTYAPFTYAQGPRTLPYEEGQPVPPGYSPREKPRIGLIIAGAVTLGVSYLFSVLAFAVDDSVSCDFDTGTGDACESDLWPLTIPVAGPFLTLGTTGGAQEGLMILILDGLAQVGGVAMLVLGLSSKKTVLVRNDLAEVQLAPLAVEGALRGIALHGRF